MITSVYYKLKAMTGSFIFLIVLLAASLVCFATAASAGSQSSAEKIKIAVVDLSGDECSEELVSILSGTDGIAVAAVTGDKAEKLLEKGKVEGILTVGTGYADAFLSDGELPLQYKSGASVSSSQAAREIIAGTVLSLQSRNDALSRLESDGYVLTDEERARFESLYDDSAASQLPLAVFYEGTSGKEAEEQSIYSGYPAFAAMVILLSLLSLSSFFADSGTRSVARACLRAERVSFRFLISDLLCLIITGVLLSLEAVAVKGGISQLPAYIAYIFCVSGLSLLSESTRAAGSVDAAAPVFVIVTGILGGCFFNISSLGGVFAAAAWITPQGLLNLAVSGSTAALLILIFVGFISAALCAAVKRY